MRAEEPSTLTRRPRRPRSAKKINSHRWALQAFAPQLDPRVVILIDVGTTPEKGSIYELWKAFDVRPRVARRSHPFSSS